MYQEGASLGYRANRFYLNATNGNRLPTPDDVLRIARDSGFRSPPTIHEMVFPKIPYLHPRGCGPVKRELILVFRR